MIEYKFTKEKNLEDYKSCQALIIHDIFLKKYFYFKCKTLKIIYIFKTFLNTIQNTKHKVNTYLLIFFLERELRKL